MDNDHLGDWREIPCGDGFAIPASVAIPEGAHAIVVFVDGIIRGDGDREQGSISNDFTIRGSGR